MYGIVIDWELFYTKV